MTLQKAAARFVLRKSARFTHMGIHQAGFQVTYGRQALQHFAYNVIGKGSEAHPESRLPAAP